MNIEFTDEEAEMIKEYVECIAAATGKAAILNALSLALDDDAADSEQCLGSGLRGGKRWK